jgi:two-component system, OmpR family, sensor kinase
MATDAGARRRLPGPEAWPWPCPTAPTRCGGQAPPLRQRFQPRGHPAAVWGSPRGAARSRPAGSRPPPSSPLWRPAGPPHQAHTAPPTGSPARGPAVVPLSHQRAGLVLVAALQGAEPDLDGGDGDAGLPPPELHPPPPQAAPAPPHSALAPRRSRPSRPAPRRGRAGPPAAHTRLGSAARRQGPRQCRPARPPAGRPRAARWPWPPPARPGLLEVPAPASGGPRRAAPGTTRTPAGPRPAAAAWPVVTGGTVPFQGRPEVVLLGGPVSCSFSGATGTGRTSSMRVGQRQGG